MYLLGSGLCFTGYNLDKLPPIEGMVLNECSSLFMSVALKLFDIVDPETETE